MAYFPGSHIYCGALRPHHLLNRKEAPYMNETKKSTTGRSSSAGWSGLYKVAIVGASSLKGKEVAEVLEQRHFPASDITLLDDESSQGQLESVGDEATFIQNVTRTSFDRTDIVFFTADAVFTRKHWAAAKAAG